MKFTLLLTQRCNLACSYCYIGQRSARMSRDVAAKVVRFAFRHTPPDEPIEVGFFGGEPLLEPDLIEAVCQLFEAHPEYRDDHVRFTVVTNGTVYSRRITRLVNEHRMGFGVSCDGPPDIHDAVRRFHGGRRSATVVAQTIRRALEELPAVMVNAVYRPETLERLPRAVEYISSLGVRQIYVNPDVTADWTPSDLERTADVYRQLGDWYVRRYRANDAHFLSLIDAKIAVILRGGYHPLERCRMGRGEFAFTPEGAIYPCERLVGDGLDGHRIGDVEAGVDIGQLPCATTDGAKNHECLDCGLRDYCMNWCGCSNYFSAGAFDRASPFICASERAAIDVALEVIETLEHERPGALADHAGGAPLANSLLASGGSRQ